jgi:hypothetical protein
MLWADISPDVSGTSVLKDGDFTNALLRCHVAVSYEATGPQLIPVTTGPGRGLAWPLVSLILTTAAYGLLVSGRQNIPPSDRPNPDRPGVRTSARSRGRRLSRSDCLWLKDILSGSAAVCMLVSDGPMMEFAVRTY